MKIAAIILQKVIASKAIQEADKLWYPSFQDDNNIIWRTVIGYSTQQEAINAAKTIENTKITYSTGRRQYKPYTHPLT